MQQGKPETVLGGEKKGGFQEIKNSLWSEFQSREQQMKAREKAEQVRQEEIEREKEEKAREEEERKRREEEERKVEAARKVEELRIAQCELLRGDTRDQLNERTEVLRELQKNKPVLPTIGLSLVEYDEDEADEDHDAEEGEL